MKPLDAAIGLWQRAPQSWRARLAAAPMLGPLVRWAANRTGPRGLRVYPLAEPLRGNRMLLDWHTQKAYVFGTHEPEVTAAMYNCIAPGCVTVDVGAHIGYHTLLMARLAGPDGMVVAFEPWPENFKVLQENVALNALSNVVLVNKAVMACSGTLKMAAGVDGFCSSTSAVREDGTVPVSSVSLDEYAASELPGQRIGFVKIDVEGAETSIFAGMAQVISSHQPTILVGLHGFSECGMSHPALLALRAAGYRAQFLDQPGAQAHVLARPEEIAGKGSAGRP